MHAYVESNGLNRLVETEEVINCIIQSATMRMSSNGTGIYVKPKIPTVIKFEPLS